MTSRTDMDRPATVLSASLGVVLIVISILLFVFVGGGTSTRYNVAWNEVADGSQNGAFAASQQTITLSTPAGQVSNVTVGSTCSDTPGTPARPATVQWTLKEGSATLDSGTFACAPDPSVKRVAINDHPDVGSIKAGSKSEAETKAYAVGNNVTHTFTLQYSYTRPAATVPPQIPVGQPSISGGMSLTAQMWHATANEPGQEATR